MKRFHFGYICRWDQCAVYILCSKIFTDPGLLKIRYSHRFVAVVIRFFNSICYMVSSTSASGQDESNPALWLATERARWSYLARSGLPAVSRKKNFPQKPHDKSFIDQVCFIKTAGYWPRTFFASLWTSTVSRSIDTQKKNLANIRPYWPHTWSITHTFLPRTVKGTSHLEVACCYHGSWIS